MILPVSTTYYQPMYINQDSTSDTQKCLERSEHADILQKTLKDEQLTDDEAERIAACVDEQKSSSATVLAIFLIGSVILLAVIIGIGLIW